MVQNYTSISNSFCGGNHDFPEKWCLSRVQSFFLITTDDDLRLIPIGCAEVFLESLGHALLPQQTEMSRLSLTTRACCLHFQSPGQKSAPDQAQWVPLQQLHGRLMVDLAVDLQGSPTVSNGL